MEQSEKDIIIDKAYEYINNVLQAHGNPVTFNSLYIGYFSTRHHHNALTEDGLKVVYNAMLEQIGLTICPNANCIDGAVSKPNIGMVGCMVCNGNGVIDL